MDSAPGQCVTPTPAAADSGVTLARLRLCPTLGPGGLRSEAVAAGAIQARSLSAAAELQCISNGHGHGHAGCDPTAAAGERRRGRVMACA